MKLLDGLVARLLGPARPRALGLVWITPDWAVGSAPRPQQLTQARGAGIEAILDLRAEARLEDADIAANGLAYYRLPVEDWAAPTQDQLASGAAWVLEQAGNGRRVLVCCRAGRGRSITLACAVLVQMGFPLTQAMTVVTQLRPTAQLSEEQVAALTAFAACRAAPGLQRDVQPPS